MVLQNEGYIFAASSPPHPHPRLGPGQQGREVAGRQACKKVQLVRKPWQSSCFTSQIVFLSTDYFCLAPPTSPLPWCAACKRLCKGVARRKVGTCCGDPASPCSVNFPPSTLTSSLTQVDPCSILSALWYKP